MVRTIEKYDVLILFLVGLIPLLWYRSGYVIAKGDYFPYILNAKSFGNDFYLWSNNNGGSPSPMPAYAVHGSLLISLYSFIAATGLWQTILGIIYFTIGAFSMAYLSKQVHPKDNLAAIVAGVFYVFNFFTILILLNVGMMWTYAFLPLLIALFIRVLTLDRNVYRNVIYFALVFAVATSVSSINLADIALMIISLASILLYYVFLDRRIPLGRMLRTLSVLFAVTFLLTAWWIIPILNYYLLSASTELQSAISVSSWSWTHARGSFLNLFWLNGGWGWRPEYFPYYHLYSGNPVLTFLVFIPFLLATVTLFFRGTKRKFNLYAMLLVLLFLFLAKGLHEPASFVNLSLYEYVPFMDMFREPFSKFTLITIPYLALLIGYSTNRIARTLTHSIHKRLRISSGFFVAAVVIVFMISAFPLLTNPIEAKTEQIPYSSYVKIPEYWYLASEWFGNVKGDFRILVTPLDDYYQVPYSWGYYGADSLIERLIERPIISPCSAYSYRIDPKSVELTNQLRETIKYNRTEEFEAAMKLLNVKYILQRNDLDYAYLSLTKRDVLDPEKMRSFLSTAPNVVLVQTIEKLDIYEYVKNNYYVHAFRSNQIPNYRSEIANRTLLRSRWNFDLGSELAEWRNATPEMQFGASVKLYLEREELKFELWNSTWGWKTISSPLVDAQYDAKYNFEFDIKGENALGVHIKMFEYSEKSKIINSEYIYYVGDGTFDWKKIQFNYVPKNQGVQFLQMQIWNGHETDKPFPNTIWMDNMTIQGYRTELNAKEILQTMEQQSTNLSAEIKSYEVLNPTKIIVKVESSGQFVLAIAEAYDPHWKAYVSGETFDSIPIFSVMNGFQINKTGQLDIVIEYKPQEWFYLASAVSLATLIVCTTYLTFTYARTKTIAREIKHKLIKPKEAREKTNPSEPNKTN